MATLKCKYCGGDISPFPDNSLGICGRCGSVMTLPKSTGKQRVAAHNCGNYLRRAGKFGKALAVYQKLLSEDETDAESCWCSALCRFGVRYEPSDNGYRPVVQRPQSFSFLECGEYLAALSLSGGAVQLQYEIEARRIAACTNPLEAPKEELKEEPREEAPSPAALLRQGFDYLKAADWENADGAFCRALEAEPDNGMAHLGRLLAQCQCTAPRELPNYTKPITGIPHYQNALQYAQGDLKKYLEVSAQKIQGRMQQSQAEDAYRQAAAAMEAAATNEAYRQAARMFGALGNYNDARAKAQECLRAADALRKEDVYRAAANAMERGDAAKAAALYSQIPGWRDANVQAVQCRKRAEAQEAAKSEAEHAAWRIVRRIACFILAVALVVTGSWLFVTKYWIPQKEYEAAEALLEAGHREQAIAAFQELGEFKDSPERVLAIQTEWYSQAEALLEAGDPYRAAIAFGGLQDYSDAWERSKALWADIITPEYISAGGWYTTALRVDGMVYAAGDNRDEQCQVGTWLNIASVSAGWEHTVGLRENGTVVVTGYNGDGRGDVDAWTHMVSVSAGQWHTVGLKSNGTVVGLGCDNDGRIDFDDWREIIGISAGRNHTVGLKADRTAVAVGCNEDGQCDVEDWTNLQSISAGGAHTLGLTRNGTVLATGSNQENQCEVSGWEDITAVSAGYYHSVGLKADGTVVAVGYNEYGQCDVSEWTDIVAISAGGWHTLGLKADGSIVAVGRTEDDQCEVSGWDNMMVPATSTD